MNQQTSVGAFMVSGEVFSWAYPDGFYFENQCTPHSKPRSGHRKQPALHTPTKRNKTSGDVQRHKKNWGFFKNMLTQREASGAKQRRRSKRCGTDSAVNHVDTLDLSTGDDELPRAADAKRAKKTAAAKQPTLETDARDIDGKAGFNEVNGRGFCNGKTTPHFVGADGKIWRPYIVSGLNPTVTCSLRYNVSNAHHNSSTYGATNIATRIPLA